MKIAKALKEKNKLKGEISALKKKISEHNRKVKGSPKTYDVQQLLAELQEKTARLVQIKTDITRTNHPVQHRIYRLAELKAMVAFCKSIPTDEGKDTVGSYSGEVMDYEAQMKEPEVDKFISTSEDEIEMIQDELDSFNHATEIQMT